MGHEPRLQHVTILAVEGCELLYNSFTGIKEVSDTRQ